MEKLDIQPLPYTDGYGMGYGSNSYNSKNQEHREIINNNNVLMRVAFDKALKKSKNPNITKLTKEQRDGFAMFLTAQAIHKSTHQTKVTGNNNYGGRKGKGKLIRTGEIENGLIVNRTEEFLNFDSLDHFAEDQVEYMDRKFGEKNSNGKVVRPGKGFYNATTYEEAIRSLMNADGQVYATDLFERGNNNKTFDANMLTNQYALKVANYIGHAGTIVNGNVTELTQKFLQPGARPDYITTGTGNYEMFVISEKGKKGKMVAHKGMYRGNYFDQAYYEKLSKGGAKLQSKIRKQKEFANNNLSEKYAGDYINSEIVQYGLTKEQIRNSIAGSAYGSIMFQELFPDNYDFGIDFGIENKNSVFDFKTKTSVDSTGEITGPVDYELSGQKDGLNLYGGEKQGEKYFGGGIKKQISSGVNIEGSFEKKGDLKQGKIKLKVEY